MTSTAGVATATLKAAQIIPVSGGGKVHQFDGIQVPLACPAGYYVERGANQTVPKKKVLVEPPVVFGPVIAKDTVPNEFGTRARDLPELFRLQSLVRGWGLAGDLLLHIG